ncbi:uncharacterized protein LOC111266244 isoform X2 [Varroa jacobsoni]|uniref:uncharacterized protein LOC111266244 isoform X2 n=1 Tax=Varroa jacobsoni TaxID=62625 RepID=UPI000BF90366|nr:uncharacterized protein LOC111266244 isoform X2 [Varroa jacobsoni]
MASMVLLETYCAGTFAKEGLDDRQQQRILFRKTSFAQKPGINSSPIQRQLYYRLYTNIIQELQHLSSQSQDYQLQDVQKLFDALKDASQQRVSAPPKVADSTLREKLYETTERVDNAISKLLANRKHVETELKFRPQSHT